MDSVRAMPSGGDAFAVPASIVRSSARQAVSFQGPAWKPIGLNGPTQHDLDPTYVRQSRRH